MTIDESAFPPRNVLRAARLRVVQGFLAVALLLAPMAARADARGDAKRHFRDGTALIAAGQIERGIEELKSAYAIKPHPDVLYNIARAYVDLGNISEALRYFRLYVATDPEDKGNVEAVMQRLSAAIATTPAEKKDLAAAEKAASAGQGAGLSGAGQNPDAQKLLAQLAELFRIGKLGGAAPSGESAAAAGAAAASSSPAEEEMFEAAPITAQTRATAKEIAGELAGEKRDDDLFEEQVVTAGTRSSSEAKAPASLTVISEEEIRMSGAATIPELLRRVPGLDVAEMNPSDVNISIRGFNRRVANKVLVLVDGRSVYQDFLGDTLWPVLDVAITDIARIEVIRGPGSALYGANAFAGVVNIITKVGDEAAGARAYFLGGNHNTVQGGFSAGGKSGKLSYRTSVGYDRADKWTKDASDDRVDVSAQFSQPNRSREVQRADVNAIYDFGKTQILAGGGFNNMAMEIFPLGALRVFGNEGQSGFARAEITSGQTKVKAFWNALRMTTGPEYWPDGLASLKSHIRSDVIDASAQTGGDFKWITGTHHLSIGAGYRFKSVDWGYLAPRPDGSTRYTEHHFNAFLQEEWQISKKVDLVISYRIDRHPLLAQQGVVPGGLVQSPRGTLMWEVKPDQILRLTVGTAFRAPTFLESYIDLLAPVPNQPGIDVRFRGDKTLQPEQMLQAELGYRGRLGGRFQPEVVVYAERVTNLISDAALTSPTLGESRDPVTGQYIIGNTGFQNEVNSAFVGLGAEVGGKWTPADGFELSVNYAFEKLGECSSNCNFDSGGAGLVSSIVGSTANHKLNVSAQWRTRSGFDLGADVHYVSAVNWVERSFDPTAAGGVLFVSYPLDAYTLVNGRIGYRLFRDKLDLGLSFYNLLGDEHREHPFGNKIGRRALFTASGAF